MGADGGVIYVPLRQATEANYARVVELLRPFWQLTSTDGCDSWQGDANWAWVLANPKIGPPAYVVGYYGTNLVADLGDLVELCEPCDDWRGDLYALTWEELDLECRTSPEAVGDRMDEHPLRRLWLQHFRYYSHEETVEKFGPLASMLARAWATELAGLLRLDCIVQEETWT